MRVGSVGSERPIVRVDNETYVEVADVVPDYNEAFFASGMSELRSVVATRISEGATFRLEGERIGAPIARPHQILCIGLNYRDHAAEAGLAIPDEPILFTKSPTR